MPLNLRIDIVRPIFHVVLIFSMRKTIFGKLDVKNIASIQDESGKKSLKIVIPVNVRTLISIKFYFFGKTSYCNPVLL